jgi:hypothetical protein
LPFGTDEFAVLCNFAVHHPVTLSCVLLAANGKQVFAVLCLTAMIGCTAAPDFPVVYAIMHLYAITCKKNIVLQLHIQIKYGFVIANCASVYNCM